jgi:hypothetical protein
MNDTFNLKRFSRLFKKTLLERPIQLSGLIGLTLLIDLILYTICRFIRMPWDMIQDVTFIFGFVGGGCFLASFVFNYFSSNAGGISYLILPASSLEKWLCGILIVGVIYTIIFLVFYRIMDIAFVEILHKSLDPKGPYYRETYDSVRVFPFDGFTASKTYIMFLNFTGAMLIGSLYFNKTIFIKVALLICLIYIGGNILNHLIAKALFENVDKALPFYCVFIPVGKDFGKVLLPDYASVAVDICLLYIVPTILWLVTFVRLREKEF